MFYYYFFFFKQKTAYEMRISDWSSDVCSSDLNMVQPGAPRHGPGMHQDHLRPVEALRQSLRVDVLQLAVGGQQHAAPRADDERVGVGQIGRASCRARVGQYV